MNKQNFDEKLKELRKLYDENHPITPAEGDVFTPLSLVEKEQYVLHEIQECLSELTHLVSTLELAIDQSESKERISGLKDKISNLERRKSILEQKLEFIRSGETDDQRKEKLKRQLLELELKRCKLKFADKDHAKVDQKINQKLDSYKKL